MTIFVKRKTIQISTGRFVLLIQALFCGGPYELKLVFLHVLYASTAILLLNTQEKKRVIIVTSSVVFKVLGKNTFSTYRSSDPESQYTIIKAKEAKKTGPIK